ncbi:DegT/DnrJ/EryC1/StrS family aminotransferase [Mariniblastus sp.]|nr:DegT/DnrJ/EryC1/StrS family aminotransferase [Mariniblastus sp.]
MSTVENMTLPSDQNSTGRTFGKAEIENITKVLESGTLTSTKGTFVKQLEEDFASMLGMDHAYACSSGTAALHVAVAAIDPEPGDEIITTSVTDMGALSCILYQGAVPRFADIDPRTYNVTAETIEKCISDRTKAIMVTHLFGNPCEMTKIMELARSRNIPVIEDCAQAFLARHGDDLIGTMGDISCFSLQQGKHITTGEGGLVVSNNPELARRAFLFINKAWGYGDKNPDHYFLALNYRMNELTGAVALAQLKSLEFSATSRTDAANKMHEMISGIPGVNLPQIHDGDVCTYWKYCLDVDPDIIEGGTDGLAQALRANGVFCAPRYIQKPAFRCQVIRDQVTFGKSRFPFNLASEDALNYDESFFPGTFEALSRVLVLPWNEKYNDDHLQFLASCIREAASSLKKS